MKKAPHHEPSNASLVLLALLLAAAFNQCGRREVKHAPQDACGGPGSHPVAIGGVMVVACP